MACCVMSWNQRLDLTLLIHAQPDGVGQSTEARDTEQLALLFSKGYGGSGPARVHVLRA